MKWIEIRNSQVDNIRKNCATGQRERQEEEEAEKKKWTAQWRRLKNYSGGGAVPTTRGGSAAHEDAAHGRPATVDAAIILPVI